ncbi:MAG: response regulator [Deltaproteobacteria bacterium]|nr:response regulator [Deltaproteobacteria bacterium]
MYELLHNSPTGAEVVIMEDEGTVLESLVEALSAEVNVACERAETMAKYVHTLQEHEDRFDAISIDWEMYDVDVGPEALRVAKRKQPNAARIVYTKHRTDQPKAIPLGADASLAKLPGGNIPAYSSTMMQGIRLGLARRILREVRALDGDGLPALPAGRLLDEDTEILIYRRSRELARKHGLINRNGRRLIQLLKRRNWWLTFDVDSYVKLPWHGKLAGMLTYANASNQVVAKILGTTPEAVDHLIQEGCAKTDKADDLTTAAQELLAVLGFLLRISGYEPEFMTDFWRLPDTPPSLSPCPWSTVGMEAYLHNGGPHALDFCAKWIRGA